jgi:hypothetical protein
MKKYTILLLSLFTLFSASCKSPLDRDPKINLEKGADIDQKKVGNLFPKFKQGQKWVYILKSDILGDKSVDMSMEVKEIKDDELTMKITIGDKSMEKKVKVPDLIDNPSAVISSTGEISSLAVISKSPKVKASSSEAAPDPVKPTVKTTYEGTGALEIKFGKFKNVVQVVSLMEDKDITAKTNFWFINGAGFAQVQGVTTTKKDGKETTTKTSLELKDFKN